MSLTIFYGMFESAVLIGIPFEEAVVIGILQKVKEFQYRILFENLRFETYYCHNYTIAAFTIGYFIFHLPNESRSMSNEIQQNRRGELAKY